MGKYSVKQFCVLADGWPTRLLQVREKKNGDLIITDERGQVVVDNNSRPELLQHQKWSVHRPDRYPNDIAVKQTLLIGKQNLTTVAWVHGSQDPLIWPIYARRPPFPLNEYRIQSKSKDRDSLYICPYDPRAWTLYYVVYVTDSSIKVPFITQDGFWAVCYRHEFRYFNIYVVPSWTSTPTLYPGYTRAIYTSAPEINEQPVASIEREYWTAIKIGRWLGNHIYLINIMSDQLLEKAIHFGPQDDMEGLEKKLRRVFPLPDVNMI